MPHRHHRDTDAAVERGQKLRQRPTARLTAAADPLWIHFGARQQVVDASDAVPGAEQSEVGAEQNETPAGVFMLARTSAERGLAGAASRVLDPFPLTERVVGQDDVAFAREIGEELLIAGPRLAVHG